jgi:hypothetical protein
MNCCILDADVVLVSETWLSNNIASSELFPNSFNVYRCDRATGRGGGVMAAVKNNYITHQINLNLSESKVESLGINMSNDAWQVNIFVLYIPPSLLVNEISEFLENFEDAIDLSISTIIVGDFNITEYVECFSGTKTTSLFNIYNQFISMNNLTQHNYIKNSNNRILDLALATDDMNIEVNEQDMSFVPLDQHHPCLNILIYGKEYANVPFRRKNDDLNFNFNKANLMSLYPAFANTNWSPIFKTEDVDSACKSFYAILNGLFSQHVPRSSTITKSSNFPVWFTKDIISKINIKNKHWNRYRKTKSLYHLDRVRELRDELRRCIRSEYKQFILSAESSIKDDPKKFWSYVNQKKRTTSVPGRMVSGETVLSCEVDIVNAFAVQFASAFESSTEEHTCGVQCGVNANEKCDTCGKFCCPSFNIDVSGCENCLMLNMFKINTSDVMSAVKKLKSNRVCGPDNIPAFIVVDCITCIVEPLCHIYNLILQTTIYPEMWKLSKIIPIFKSGDKSDIKNYRQIALLSNFAKVFESVLSSILYSHVIGKISPEQHGFIKGRSTASNLFEFSQFVSNALDKRQQVDVIYTDLSKAFDCVHHCILLTKLKSYGLCDSVLALIKSIISGRQQFVEYAGVKSQFFSVNSGVAQGSNLGPLLFIIFYNDVVNIDRCKKFIYADDLKIAHVIHSITDSLELQQSIDRLTVWCDKNKMRLNISKCKIISFTRKSNIVNFFYNINGSPLARCNEISDLGVIMDNTLSFTSHIMSITNTAMKMLGFVCRNTKEFTNISCIKQLFYGLVRSRLEYCCVVFKPYQQLYINMMEGVLRKFAKYVYFKMFNCYPSRHCDQTSLISIVNEQSLLARRNICCLIFLQKIIKGDIESTILIENIKFVIPRINARSPSTFYYDIPNSLHHFNSPLIYCLRLYNCLFQDHIDIFHDNFKSNIIKKQLIAKYS